MRHPFRVIVGIAVVVMAVVMYYRSRHFARVARMPTEVTDPYKASHAEPSQSVNHTMKTIDEINRINKLNQEQNKAPSSDRKSSK